MSTKRTLSAVLPDGTTTTCTTTRAVTHVVATHNEARNALCADGLTRAFSEEWVVFRWSAAPDTAVKELQRRGWGLGEIAVIPID